MSDSTNATLFYGYCWDEENAIDDQLRAAAGLDDGAELPGWDETAARRDGAYNPWDSFEELEGVSYAERTSHVDAWCEKHRAAIDSWRAACKAAEARYVVELDRYCHSEYAKPMLSAWQIETSSYVEINALPEILPEWREQLDRWLADFGVEAPQLEPRFWLVSYYG